jgi:hypothetical protein
MKGDGIVTACCRYEKITAFYMPFVERLEGRRPLH